MTTTPATMMAYVGISACGCILEAVVDELKDVKTPALYVAEFIRGGCTIERMPVEQARVKFCSDKHMREKGRAPICPHPQACPHRSKEPKP